MFQAISDTIYGTSSSSTTHTTATGEKVNVDFKDEVAGEVDSEVTFDVSQEEISIIKAELAGEYPEDYDFLSTAYIESVASKPYSKDTSVRRPIDYTIKKLKDLLQWREGHVIHLHDLYAIMTESDKELVAKADDTQKAKAKAFATSLNYASMYWHGLDKKGRPVLWIRTDRMVCVCIIFTVLVMLLSFSPSSEPCRFDVGIELCVQTK